MHVNRTNKDLETNIIFRTHEQAKKREYLERVFHIEYGSFTPLVFGTNGESKRFVTSLTSGADTGF